MRGHVLFISKEERTAEEVWNNMLRFHAESYAPETFYADLDNPDIAEGFEDEKERFNLGWSMDRLENLRKQLQEAKEGNKPSYVDNLQKHIEYLQEDVERLEAYNNGDLSVLNDEQLALKKGNLAEWVDNIKGFIIKDGVTYYTNIYKIRDGKIYTIQNLKNSFWDGAFDDLLYFLTDKNGNEVESCICKDIDFSKLSELSNNITAIVWEDSDENLHFDDDDYRDYGKSFERKFNEAINSIPPDSYVRILQYHTSII